MELIHNNFNVEVPKETNKKKKASVPAVSAEIQSKHLEINSCNHCLMNFGFILGCSYRAFSYIQY